LRFSRNERMNNETWIPGEGWITFGRHYAPELPEYVPVHDPREPRRSPYYVPPPPVPVAEPVPAEPVAELAPGAKAEAFLRDVLAVDPVPATEVQRLAENASIAARTLRRARERMNVRVFKKSGCWWWALPGWEDVRP
jgi:hypothetical protein